MKPIPISVVIIAFVSTSLSAQIGIGTSSPSANAALEISSVSKGLLLPRLTTSERNNMNTPSEGLLIYNTSTNQVQVYTATESTYLTAGLADWGSMFLGSTTPVYQTITAPNNEKVKSVNVSVYVGSTGGTVTMSIYNGTGNGGALLATVSQNLTTTGNQTLIFPLNPAISLPQGNTFTLYFTVPGVSPLSIYVDTTNPYSGGDSNHSGGGWDLLLSMKSEGSWANLN